MSARRIEFNVEREGERVKLLSPAVGAFSQARHEGQMLSGGEVAGVLTTLGASCALIVPEGVAGVIVSAAPERVMAPVDFGAVLYELAPLAAGAAAASSASNASAAGGLVFRSPSAGRFWQRSAPSEPALANVGDELTPGKPLGLIEVMKTFTQVAYATAGGLPARARIVRVLLQDGAEVSERAPLFELEAL